jgi:NADPH:quinone reductase-like Zn-dependent oxidoreductase
MSPNPVDYKLTELGRLVLLLLTRSFTASPGRDFAGVIEEVGSAVNSSPVSDNAGNDAARDEDTYVYKPGDAVYGRVTHTAFGTLGEYIHATPSGCVPLPSSVSPADASTLGTAALSAYQALVPYVRPGKGDEVFINGGSGGVGTYAIQIAAKVLGCVVTTSCSTRNISLCTALGASTVLDYTSTSVTEALRARGQVFRVVVDNVGVSPADLYKAADDYLLPEGTYVQIGGGVSELRTLAYRALWPTILGGGRRKWKLLVADQQYDHLAQLGQWMQEGKIRAVIDGDIFAFEDVTNAFEKLKTGRVRGKLVIKVSD